VFTVSHTGKQKREIENNIRGGGARGKDLFNKKALGERMGKREKEGKAQKEIRYEKLSKSLKQKKR